MSMEFSRQEYWSGLLFPTLGDLPNPVTEPRSLLHCRQTFFLPSEPLGKGSYRSATILNSKDIVFILYFTFIDNIFILFTIEHIYIWLFPGGAGGKEPAC